jgi:hypothetical protein
MALNSRPAVDPRWSFHNSAIEKSLRLASVEIYNPDSTSSVYDPETNTPDGGTPLRKNYAIIGGLYDKERDAFYEVQPYPSWILDDETCKWQAPIPYPDAPNSKIYFWDEANLEWYVSFDKETGEYTIRPNAW